MRFGYDWSLFEMIDSSFSYPIPISPIGRSCDDIVSTRAAIWLWTVAFPIVTVSLKYVPFAVFEDDVPYFPWKSPMPGRVLKVVDSSE